MSNEKGTKIAHYKVAHYKRLDTTVKKVKSESVDEFLARKGKIVIVDNNNLPMYVNTKQFKCNIKDK